MRAILESYKITSPFGWRTDPITGARQWHNGVDLSAAVGTPVRAPWAGTTYTFSDSLNGTGLRIVHDPPAPIAASLYVHLSAYGPGIVDGTKVLAGDTIALTGNTGRSTGPHLHLTFRGRESRIIDDVPRIEVDPTPYLDARMPGLTFWAVALLLFAVVAYLAATRH